MPVSHSHIKARALYEAKKQNVTNFKTSDGWFWRWQWRYNIPNSILLHTEADDVDLEAADKIEELRTGIDTLVTYEMSLFSRTIPNRMYLIQGDKQAGRAKID